MRHFTLLTIIGFLVGSTLVVKAENSSSNTNITIVSLLDLTDRDTTVSKANAENESSTDEEVEAVEVVIELSPKQEKDYVEENMPTEPVNAVEIVITPMTRYKQPSEDTKETMIMKVDEETGEEYFVRKNYAPSNFQKLQSKRKYKRRANKLEARGMKKTS